MLVNNAGIGWLNPLEATGMDTVRDLFATNTFGTIAVTQALLPQLRGGAAAASSMSPPA